jgi:hypothetical protein
MTEQDFATTLTEATRAAIRKAWPEVRDAHAAERLSGYALLTDDGLQTMGHVACSDEFLAECPVSNAWYNAVEWTYDEGVHAFDGVREIMVTHGRAANTPELFGAHVEEAFAALVAAMRALKAEGVFGDTIFLTVLSTDPNERLLELEGMAVQALNERDVYEKWRKALDEDLAMSK